VRAALTRLASLLAVLAVVAPAWIAFRWHLRPDLDAYRGFSAPAASAAPGALRATFLGVSTIWFDDGETGILIDGFFSRPGVIRSLLGHVEPDRSRVKNALHRARIERAAAVIAVHSHYDHVMDSPLVAELTGAVLVGSESTANVARGWGLPAERIRPIEEGSTLRYGRFGVTLLRTAHFPHGMAMGEIRKPLVTPARATDYKEGGSYSVLIEHDGRTVLVQGSAGFVPGALRGRSADTVFLGLAGLGTREPDYRESYWREVVAAVGAKRVFPVHWDDFTRSLDEPLSPLPGLIDDIPGSFDFLLERSAADGVEFQFVDAWQTFDPFASR
jgi:L-ascorbate metabolism protein UlaG (beta-lactamase superfamily)